MSELTNQEKIDLMTLASSIVCNDESEAVQDHTKNPIILYHAMIKAITSSGEDKAIHTGPSPIVVSKETAR